MGVRMGMPCEPARRGNYPEIGTRRFFSLSTPACRRQPWSGGRQIAVLPAGVEPAREIVTGTARPRAQRCSFSAASCPSTCAAIGTAPCLADHGRPSGRVTSGISRSSSWPCTVSVIAPAARGSSKDCAVCSALDCLD